MPKKSDLPGFVERGALRGPIRAAPGEHVVSDARVHGRLAGPIYHENIWPGSPV